MKNRKIIGGLAAIALTGAVLSFTSGVNGEDPEMKQYEVIRMMNGEMTVFDTLIPKSSDYSADDYLSDLGFSEDKNVSIINLLDHFNEIEMTDMHHGDAHGEHKMMFIEMDEKAHEDIEMDENGNMVIIKMDGEEIHEIKENGEGNEVIIEKRVIKTSDGENEEMTIDIDVEGIVEGLNVDSLIKVAMNDDGEANVVMHKVLICDDSLKGMDGSIMEFHEMDVDGAHYHKEIGGDNHHMKVAVWGDEEDFTLLIVSDPNVNGGVRKGIEVEDVESSKFKLYPNPTSTTSQIQLNFDEKATTTIHITDMKGRTVAKMDLGSVKGQLNHDINVSKWSKGVYIVQVEHGNEKMIERLIVE
jgi:hypothetical protein